MAAGDLSSAQARYVADVARGTGLRHDVVAAWVGQESGWNVTKPGHNYLNIGPGRRYGSVGEAAAAAVNLIASSGHYAGIRASVGRGPCEQIAAITSSPWDAGNYGGDGSNLRRTYQSVTGQACDGSSPLADGARAAAGAVAGGAIAGIPGMVLGFLTGSRGADDDGLVDQVADRVALVGLNLLFVGTGLALVAWGVVRTLGVADRAATTARLAADLAT